VAGQAQALGTAAAQSLSTVEMPRTFPPQGSDKAHSSRETPRWTLFLKLCPNTRISCKTFHRRTNLSAAQAGSLPTRRPGHRCLERGAADARRPPRAIPTLPAMSAVFNFQSLLVVVLLLICTCAYIRSIYPSLLDRNKEGFLGVFWKAARIGERLSPYVAVSCVVMSFSLLFGR
jgi:Protein of unknown function (DUF1242)